MATSAKKKARERLLVETQPKPVVTPTKQCTCLASIRGGLHAIDCPLAYYI